MNLASNTSIVNQAIKSLLGGSKAADLEGQMLDFKEEAGTFDSKLKTRKAIPDNYDPAAQALAGEVSCFANTERGGVLIVGVNDKASGEAAFVGTHLSIEWLRSRIYELIQYPVEIEEKVVCDQRIYVIYISPTPYGHWVKYRGRITAREGDKCLELDAAKMKQISKARIGHDWSGQPSGYLVSQIDKRALEIGFTLYEKAQNKKVSKKELLQNLNILTSDNPEELTNAGALLFCEYQKGSPKLKIIVADDKNSAANIYEEYPAPLLVGLDSVISVLEKQINKYTYQQGLQKITYSTLPEQVWREAVANAIIHRDYEDAISATEITLELADDILKITSPGMLQPPITEENIFCIATSRPTNPQLAFTARILKFAEQRGIGARMMFKEMLRRGYSPPRIFNSPVGVTCQLQGGELNQEAKDLFDKIGACRKEVGYFIAYDLFHNQYISLEEDHTYDNLFLEKAKDVEELVKSGVFSYSPRSKQKIILSSKAKKILQANLTYRTQERHSFEQQSKKIKEYISSHGNASSGEIGRMLGVRNEHASRILSDMVKKGELKYLDGIKSGRDVKYISKQDSHTS